MIPFQLDTSFVESSFLESEFDATMLQSEPDESQKVVVFENALQRLFHRCQVMRKCS